MLARLTWPHALLGLATLFRLVALRGETRFAQPLNDSSFHMQMVRWAGGQIHRGRVPLDGWFPYSLARLVLLPPLPEPPGDPYRVRRRRDGRRRPDDVPLDPLPAARDVADLRLRRIAPARLGTLDGRGGGRRRLAARVSAPSYGFERGSYIWQGYRRVSPALGDVASAARVGAHVAGGHRDGRRYAAAAIAVALTIACHFIAGYLALLTIGVWVIALGAGPCAAPRRARRCRRGWRAAHRALGARAADRGRRMDEQSEYFRGTFFNDSYGAGKVLGWLFRGQLFDHGRFPVITLLFAGGLVVCIVRGRDATLELEACSASSC